MSLKHDAQGFLVGEPFDIGKLMPLWSGISNDIRSIRDALSGRDSSPGAPLIATPSRSIAESDSPSQSVRRSAATPRERDEQGRFLSKSMNDSPAAGGGGNPAPNTPASESFLKGLANRLSRSALSAGSGMEEADPAVKAIQEIAQPMARGYEMLTGGSEDKKQTGLLRRLVQKITGKGAAAKTATPETAAAGGEGGGFMGLISGMFPKLAGMVGGLLPMLGTVFTSVLAPIAGVIAAWNVGQWIGTKIYEWMSESGINDIIFDGIDSIVSGVTKAWDNSVAGFNSFVDAAKSGWDSVIGVFKSAYEGLKSIPLIGPAIQAAENAVKKTIDVAKGAGDAAKNAYEAKTAPGSNPNAPKPEGAVNKTAAAVGGAAGSVVVGAKNIGASLSAIIAGGESGKEGYDAYNRGTGLGSTGHRDISKMSLDEIAQAQKLDKSDTNRLMAVGKYQMMPSTLAEGAKALGLKGDTKFDADTQEKLYADYLVGKKRPQIKDYITGKTTDSTAAQVAMAQEWRSVADPRTGATYADKGAAGNKASITADQSKAAMDAAKTLYSQNINDGMSEQEAYRKAVSTMRPITKDAGGTTAIAQSSAQSAPASLLAVATPKMPTAMASSAAPSIPSAPSVPALAESPSLVDPLASGGGRPVAVATSSPDVRQDLSDRRIAHIVNGGMT